MHITTTDYVILKKYDDMQYTCAGYPGDGIMIFASFLVEQPHFNADFYAAAFGTPEGGTCDGDVVNLLHYDDAITLTYTREHPDKYPFRFMISTTRFIEALRTWEQLIVDQPDTIIIQRHQDRIELHSLQNATEGA